MTITIHQPQYLPWLGYFDKIDRADVFVLLDNVQFKKNEWQNRNRIRTSQGWQWLTIPVIHDFGKNINEIKINNTEAWRRKHLTAIEINYCKTPHFEQYFPVFQEILNQEWEILSAINICFVRKLMEILGIKTRVVLASEYTTEGKATVRLVDLCKQLNAETYLSGQGGGAYLDEEQFKRNNIKMVVQEYQHPNYPQVQANQNEDGFVSHLSVIDLLFNCGPQSLRCLKGEEILK